ncbi:M48 family metalloprotease [Amylibacter sp.]|jgi:predicted Zn-dependent protease|nr:M48 family metalloprotease [Amylibacter sp.]MDB4095157.1 M48 family metalloprotease [Amylibacter sp.]MDB4191532.1 M48 family metalloprotease [Amylibacter sp.]MDB9807515.1 M48 family metalloprotease [Amylibacter sp.]MDC1444754.1 M48 family metalloprotease [Amylibacter sp.]|tara:strand:- start:8810 stop:10126 length:1317 start_codon:yes stop_codon:yes gene_type:complete
MKRIFYAYLLILLLFPTISYGKGILRDAEIERTLKIITLPLLENTKIDQQNFKVLVINDSSMNAFVTSGQYIFIHYGLINKMETVEQLQSVIAHEIGHITGGHYIQRTSDIESARTLAGIGMILSAAAGLVSGDSNIAIGLAAGSQSASKRNFLKHSRTQEASADQAGIKLMAAANINPHAALEVLEIFKGQELLTAKRQDPYIQTHPLNSQRISSIQKSLKTLNFKKNEKDKNIDYMYNRMRAKFKGFTEKPFRALQTTNIKKNDELNLYTRAIAYHRLPDLNLAQKEINKLLELKPNDPYYNELKAQFLLETGNPNEAIKYYNRALELEPNELLFNVGLSRALNSIGKYKSTIKILKNIYDKDPRNGRLLRELAIAYSQNGELGWASLLTAERYALYGKFNDALLHAKRAQSILVPGTIAWLKVEDLILEIESINK